MWSVFHAKATPWRSRRHFIPNCGFYTLASSRAGKRNRHWCASELQKLKVLQVRMTRRIAHWFPREEEDWAAFPALQRVGPGTLASERDPQLGPGCGRHVVAFGGPRPSHGRAQPHRWIATVLGWRDPWWRDTVHGLHGSSIQTGALNRLGRGHRHLGPRRWDDAVQPATSQQSDAPWQVFAQDRAAWRNSEPHFIARVPRCSVRSVARVPPGGHMHA